MAAAGFQHSRAPAARHCPPTAAGGGNSRRGLRNRAYLDTVLGFETASPWRKAGSVSPSPRFAESAEQNGERAGVRCLVYPYDVRTEFRCTQASKTQFLQIDPLAGGC